MRLLVVEDNIDLAKALKTIFERHHYSVDVITNGIDAVYYGLSDNYDGMILDVMLPGKNGFEVLKEIRAEQRKIPILMLTAKSLVEDKIEGLDLGADDYLAKPFDMQELLARVRAMLRRKEVFKTNMLSYKDLILDDKTYELKYKDQCLKLGKKEYLMMEMLIEYPNEVVTSTQFIEHIWGWHTDIENNVLWVYISNLRQHLKKLDAPFEIRTKRGIGYALGDKHD